ncbi:hypothetical protein ACP70R_038194 [Stipagrostis hirtigluma subsp. patula]
MAKTAVNYDAPDVACFSDDPEMWLLHKAHRLILYALIIAVTPMMTLPLLFMPYIDEVPSYTVDLAAFQGLMTNATLGHRAVSPAFNLTVHAENRLAFQGWCHNHGEVVVSYGGAALAWGRVPGFCLRRRSAANFTLVAWGKGVHLSDELRGRLTSEWRKGTGKVFVEMKLHYYPNYYVFLPSISYPGTLSISQELILGDTRTWSPN